jgi:hypothetical protein
LIQVGHERLQLVVRLLWDEVPIEALRRIPFPPLAKFPTHEDQLLAAPGPHVGEQRSQVSEFLPAVTRRLIEERAFAVHYLIMRKRHNEVLAPRIELTKGEIFVMVPTMDRLFAER